MSDKCKFYKRADTGKYVVWVSWKGKRYTRGHYDNRIDLVYEELAKRLSDAINQDIDDKGDEFDPRMWFSSDKELQFSHAVDKWYKGKDYAPGTVRNVERALSLAKSFFKDTNIKTIRKAHLKAFFETLTQGPTTKQSMMGWVKTALNDICDDWHLMRIPFPRISLPYKEQKWISREQQEKIISFIPKADQPIFRFMMAYGLRPSEACALMWDAIDKQNETITIKRTFSGERHLRETTKSGYYRRIPLSSDIAELLKPLRLDIRNQFVFKNALGNHYQRSPLWNIWNKACKKAGIMISLKNGFRHSKITQLQQAGHDIKKISQFIGHRKVATTEIYDHESVNNMKEMVG